MKKLKSTIPNGGAPLGTFPVLRELFDEETKNAIEAMINSVVVNDTQGVVLKGCAVSGIVSNWAIAEGYIYVDGEVLYYAGGSGFSAAQYLKKDAVTEEGGVFADAVTRDYIDVNTAIEYSTTGGGAGTQYITLNFDTEGQTLADLIKPTVRVKTLEIGVWNMQGTASVSVAHGVTRDNIRGMDAIIYMDNAAGTEIHKLQFANDGGTNGDGSISIQATDVVLTRTAGQAFDSADFNSTTTPTNRGWITIHYVD